jgi:hypothetical protein
VDLQRLTHQVQRASADDAEARQRARSVRAWRDHEQGMAGGKWWLPDVDGVLVDKVLEHMAERMRPETGEPWDSLAHRKADALVELARTYADAEPTGRFRIEIVNIVDPNATTFGPSVDGIPIAAETLAALTPQAKMRDCVIDEAGVARTVRRVRHALPADVERHVRRRDHHCRDPAKLAGVCPYHHRFLEPHGPYRLIGNAEDPEGLRLEHRDERPRDGPDP